MHISVRGLKTGKTYLIELRGDDQRLVIRVYTLLGLTGSLFALTLMSFFAMTTEGRPYSQEIFFALAIGTLLAARRALTLFSKAKKMLERLIEAHESKHPQE